MNSDVLANEQSRIDTDRTLLTALHDRAASLETGLSVDLSDLERRDPCGPEAFAALARRFGLAPSGDRWVLEKKPRWQPGWILQQDETAWLDLFEAAFGYRMDPRLWRWKYRDAPGRGVGVWRDGRLVGFYGAMPRPTLFLGRPVSTVQIGDVMSHPAERGVLTRAGPFQIAASTFIERSVGHGRAHLFGFGFPTAKALQVAQKLGLYEQVDQMAELSWPAGGSSPTTLLLRTAPLLPSDERTVNALWEAMAADFRASIIGVRDWKYVRERFLQHPTVRYDCLLVRRRPTGAAQGVFIVRRHQDGLELMDLIAPPRQFPALIAAARRWATRQGVTGRLKAWVTASHAGLLAATGPAVSPMDLVVPANVWSPGPSPDELRDRWWLTGGDTDFR